MAQNLAYTRHDKTESESESVMSQVNVNPVLFKGTRTSDNSVAMIPVYDFLWDMIDEYRKKAFLAGEII